ncbi:OPT super [Blastocladiella emersonii ATCC 22665]|nr:OPT super [Blastocladiella emersonii ATCC 22665]
MGAADVKNEKAAELDKKKSSSFVVDEEFESIVNDIVPTTDDVNTPSLTLRVWIIGTVFTVVLGVLNQIFTFRTNSFAVSSYVAVLLSYPMGLFMAKVIPSVKFSLFGVEVDTNPGPFSVKEHVLIGIFGSTGAAGIYGTDNLVVQQAFYNLDVGYFWGLLFLYTTSTLGFGIAGVCRRFLIRPAHMICVALYTAFHDVKVAGVAEAEGKHWSQFKVFGIGALGMAIYHFIGPGFLAPMLGYFPILCWIAPNTVLAKYGSPMAGTGILSFNLDWTTFGSAAMSVPYWSAVNQFVSYVLFMWIISPLAAQGNWFNQPKPKISLNSSKLMNNAGKKIGAEILVDPATNILIDEVYAAQKPVFMSPFFAWSYFGSMAQFTSSISHTAVWYGKDIVNRFRYSQSDADDHDVHCQLIDKYPEVPDTWYYGFFVFTAVVSIIVGQFSGIQTEWWVTILAIIVSILGTIPISVVYATAGVALFMNVIAEFIIGIILPGRPIVMMAFKCLGVTVSNQCLTLLSDLKLGHYMKVPPRHVFIVQIFSQLLACFICLAVMESWIKNPEKLEWLKDNGGSDGPGKVWGATGYNVYYNASLIWGAIGPIRFFFESVYSPIIIGGLVAGAVLPIIFRVCAMFIPGIPWHLFHASLLFTVGSPGSNQSFVLSSFLVSTFFQFYMYRWHSGWWRRNNYVLATAFDVGAALVAIIITFVIADNGITAPVWLLSPDAENPDEMYGPYGDWCHFEA